MEATAAAGHGTVMKIRFLQTAAVFASWGWWPTAWRRIDDSAAGLRRAEFRFDIGAGDVSNAIRVNADCRNNMQVRSPDVGRYNRAFRLLKKIVDETEAEVGQWQRMTHTEEQADER